MKLIISHNNERTLNKTIENSQRLGFDVYPIHDGPFYRTYIKSMKTGMAFDDEWFVFMGGDQFLLDSALTEIKKYIEKVAPDVWAISGSGFDYLWQCKRKMTPSVYRVKFVKKVGKFLNTLDNSVTRPEGHVIRAMEKARYRYFRTPAFEVGNHDFEQYYRDIYRKGRSQVVKSPNPSGWFLKIKANKNKTMDHLVFERGIEDQLCGRESDIFKLFNITEKPPLCSII